MKHRSELVYSLTEKYYNYWGNQNIAKLRYLLSDNIILIDPVIKKAEGIEAVLAINNNIFKSCKAIEIVAYLDTK